MADAGEPSAKSRRCDIGPAGNGSAPEAEANEAETAEEEEAADAVGAEGAAAEAGDEYFRVYGDLAVHLLMLGDAPRVGTYVAALRAHRASIEGKVVLDIGAGSGILSMAAAYHGGAKRVYAVEAAPGVARLARALVRRNDLQETVKIVEGLVEAVELPEKVDVIVSEWMGFYLLHESMLDSVLAARDRWLRPGGLVLPGSARIWTAPVEAEELRREVEGYASFHGLNFEPVAAARLEQETREPQVELVDPGRLLAEPALAWDFPDLAAMKREATAEISAEVSFVASRRGHAAGIVLWFDVGFGAGVNLPTGPGAPATHWKQTVVYLGAFPEVEAGDPLSVRIHMRQSTENRRQYEITLETL